MTAAQPDPSETVRLLPADTFTEQTRAEWVELVGIALLRYDFQIEQPFKAAFVVDALLAHLAAQQARPMPGGGGQ